MHVEIIELLRCPVPHEPSPLVTVAFERDGDWLLEGLLGCSVCGAEFALTDGVVDFAMTRDATGLVPDEAMIRGVGAAHIAEPTESADPLRLAALLGLNEPGMRVLLCGDVGDGAPALALATGARCIVVNGTAIASHDRDTDRMTMPVAALLPFADRALNGLVVDVRHAALLAQAAARVRVGGRVVAPASALVPAGCRELARDAQQWVAQVESMPSAVVPLRTRDRSTRS